MAFAAAAGGRPVVIGHRGLGAGEVDGHPENTLGSFLAAAEATFSRLAGTPGMGTRLDHGIGPAGEVRYLPLDRFRKYLAF